MASIQASGFTICVLDVGSHISADLDQNRYWQGYGDPPAHIGGPKPRPAPSTFTHKADSVGSIGGLAYDVGNHPHPQPQPMPPKWIVAWSNERGMHNKVYTKILRHNEHINWHRIKDILDRSGPASTDDLFGFKAEAKIDPSGDTPTMRAKLMDNKAA